MGASCSCITEGPSVLPRLHCDNTSTIHHQYSSQIKTISEFWDQHIKTLSKKELTELGTKLFITVDKLICDEEPLFVNAPHSFFKMFEWFINELKNHDSDSGETSLIKHFRKVGKLHKKFGIKLEHFKILLRECDKLLSNKFGEIYSLRIQFCFDELYKLVTDIMLGKDFHSMSIKHSTNLSNKLASIDTCLKDKIAVSYLEKYMESHFCVEMLLFCKDMILFKKKPTYKDAYQIYNKYILPFSECEINISYETRMKIINTMHKTNSLTLIFNCDLFDEAFKEMRTMIVNNVWNDFKLSMYELMKPSLTSNHSKSLTNPSTTIINKSNSNDNLVEINKNSIPLPSTSNLFKTITNAKIDISLPTLESIDQHSFDDINITHSDIIGTSIKL